MDSRHHSLHSRGVLNSVNGKEEQVTRGKLRWRETYLDVVNAPFLVVVYKLQLLVLRHVGVLVGELAKDLLTHVGLVTIIILVTLLLPMGCGDVLRCT